MECHASSGLFERPAQCRSDAMRAPSASGAQLELGDVRIHGPEAGEGAEAAVGAGDHALASDNVGVSGTMRSATSKRMLDVIGGRADHAGDRGSCRREFADRANTAHSCAWRGLAASNSSACGFALITTGSSCSSGTS